MSEIVSLSSEDKVAAILKYGEHGDIIVDISLQPGIKERLKGVDQDVMIRMEFARWIRNYYELWERFRKIVGESYIPVGDIDDHEEHPDRVSYDIAEAVCRELEIKFRDTR